MNEWIDRHYVVFMSVLVGVAVLLFGTAILGPILWPNLGAEPSVTVCTTRVVG